jgi:hypothetical protein
LVKKVVLYTVEPDCVRKTSFKFLLDADNTN